MKWIKKIIISSDGADERIDKFLREGFFLNMEVTRGDIGRYIKEGDILVNKRTIKPSYIIKINDIIDICIARDEEVLIPNENIKVEIIYQDNDFIVINKPAGLQVHPSDTEKVNTLTNYLVAKFPEIINVNDDSQESWMRPGIVHRLDKDTSGVMVVARNKETFYKLKEQFADRMVIKNYVAVVYGHLKEKDGTINKSIARAASFKKQKIAQGKTKGLARQAITKYSLIKRYSEFDFVEAIPKTGRMHQIRVHLSSLGNPIVGDDKYKRKNIIPVKGLNRHFLHAQKIQFNLKNKEFRFIAELPTDFSSFLASLD